MMERNSLLSTAVPHCFTSRLFVPTWWVKAFEIGNADFSESMNAVELAVETGLTPALGVDALNGMSLIIAALQQQLLRGETVLTLDPEKHRKFITSPAKLRAFSFERALHDMAALKLLFPEEQGFRTVPLFAEEHWRLNEKKKRVFVELRPADHCAEVILGYVEPYHNLARKARGEPQAKDILGAQAPLAIWRSAWLDLQGIEQVLLLRMEKAVQWEYRWLHLDGAFGISHTALFRDLAMPRSRVPRDAEVSAFKQRQKILLRLGTKLVDHGYLLPNSQLQHLAFTKDEQASPLSLVWNLPPERLIEEDRTEYLSYCHEYLLRERLIQGFASTFRTLSGPLLNEGLERQWLELEAYFRTAPTLHDLPLAVVDGNLLVSYEGLFAEWSLRSHESFPLPLPTWLKESQAGKLARQGAGSAWSEIFPAFVQCLNDHPALLNEIKRQGQASLVTELARNDSSLWPYLRQARPAVSKAPAATSVGDKTMVADKATAIEPERRGASASPDAQRRSESSRKRMVSEQLAAMREHNPRAYEDLKRLYLEGLDAQRKKILMEVQDRLPPHMLDEQLRHSLIKFMLDNPSAWQAVKA